MTDEARDKDELTEEELARDGEELPAREVMSVISPEPPIGRIPDEPFIQPNEQ